MTLHEMILKVRALSGCPPLTDAEIDAFVKTVKAIEASTSSSSTPCPSAPRAPTTPTADFELNPRVINERRLAEEKRATNG